LKHVAYGRIPYAQETQAKKSHEAPGQNENKAQETDPGKLSFPCADKSPRAMVVVIDEADQLGCR